MKKALLLVVLVITSYCAQAQWSALGSGLNGRVKALAVFNNEIYAGGTFTTPSRVAKWNGSAWVVAGNGLNDSVNVLTVHNGQLYAGGHFTQDGSGTSVRFIARLNTSTNKWEAVANNHLNNFVRALHSSGGFLYCGGAFINSGTPAVSRIARFDGTTFAQVGDIPTNVVNTITTYNGSIYIGGAFSSFVSKLSGSNWQGLSGLNFEVNALYPFGSTLYIGGKFTSPSQYLATYNGVSVGSSFNSVNGTVHALYSTPSKLFVGGSFTSSPSTGASLLRFFSYNGNSPFFNENGGFNGDVLSIANLNGRIVVGGSFSTAGSTSATNVAISANTISVDEIAATVVSKTFYPNPLLSEATLQLLTKEPVKHPVLRVMDTRGKLVMESDNNKSMEANEIKFIISRNSMAAGLYYYSVSDQNGNTLLSDKFIVE